MFTAARSTANVSKDKAALELLTSLMQKTCGYVKICHRNPTEDAPETESHLPNIPCCYNCSCSDECLFYSNCCPDKFQNYTTNYINVNADAPKPGNLVFRPYACVDTELYSSFREHLVPKVYYMVNTCDPGYLDQITVKLCEEKTNLSIIESAPLTVYATNITYRNIHCIKCNFQSNETAVTWKPVLTCTDGRVGKIQIGFNSAEDIAWYLRKAETMLIKRCFIFYKLPPTKKKLIRVEECETPNIDTCNVTGQWGSRDKLLERACKLFTIPVKGYILSPQTLFKNVACLKCNVFGELYVYATCVKVDVSLLSEVYLNIYSQNKDENPEQTTFDADIETPWTDPNSSVFPIRNSNQSCPDGYFLDKYTVREMLWFCYTSFSLGASCLSLSQPHSTPLLSLLQQS